MLHIVCSTTGYAACCVKRGRGIANNEYQLEKYISNVYRDIPKYVRIIDKIKLAEKTLIFMCNKRSFYIICVLLLVFVLELSRLSEEKMQNLSNVLFDAL